MVYVVRWQLYILFRRFPCFFFSFNIVVSASGSAVVVVVDVGMEGMQ